MVARPTDIAYYSRAAVVRSHRLEAPHEDVVPGEERNRVLEVLGEPPIARVGEHETHPVAVEVSRDDHRTLEVADIGHDGPGLIGPGGVRGPGGGLEVDGVDPGGIAPDDDVRGRGRSDLAAGAAAVGEEELPAPHDGPARQHGRPEI